MGLVFLLSYRNLLRQKRRNFFLGIGIGFGMMILVVANAFSHGMVEVLLNDIVANAFGHLVIQGNQGHSFFSMISDKERILTIVQDTIKTDELLYINENLGMFGRAVGNGEADNIMVAGVTVKDQLVREEFFNNFFTLVTGNFEDYFSTEIEYPVIISAAKAKSLNVQLHDVIKMRLPMITGRIQAVKLTVIAIVNANNTFMDVVMFMDGQRVKELLGYHPWDSASLQIALKDPQRTAAYYAELLHARLQPNLISIIGQVGNQGGQLLAFQNNAQAKQLLKEKITMVSGETEKAFSQSGVMVSRQLAQKLHLKPGEDFYYQYQTKYRGFYQEKLTLNAVYDSDTRLGGDIILLNEERVHPFYHQYLPADSNWNYITANNPLHGIMAAEWKLLDRSRDSQALRKKYREERQLQTSQPKLDVLTMYEGASDILKLEGVLNSITMIVVLVLFFIILLGVVNTLRMTLKERTREIGTIRAIGMQRNDVRNLFMLETLFLTTISCLAGIFLGIIAIKILGTIEFDLNNAFSIILKNSRLYFKINPTALITSFLLILGMAALAAYFPARKAANLLAVEALRHYE